MKMTRISALSITAATLAACGGSGGGTVPPPPPPEPTTQDVARADVASASVFTDWTAVNDTRTAERTRPSDGNTQTIALNLEDADPLEQSAFASFSNAEDGGRWRLFEATGPGGITARVTGFVNDTGNLSYGPQTEYLTSGGSIPLNGTATYSGDYVGMLTLTSGTTNPNFTSRYVTGDIAVTADFGNEVLDGRISNREAFRTFDDEDLYNLADVTLTNLDLTGGRSSSFGATASGGAIQASGYTPASSDLFGNWTAATAGTEAEALTGAVYINHNYTGSTRDASETGVFVATKN